MHLTAADLFWIGLLATQAIAPQPTSQKLSRSELPIRETVLLDGTHRYSVPVRVGSAQIEAGLDTGSTGLRVLSTELKDGDVQLTKATDYMTFGGGARLDGNVAEATIAIGSISGKTTLQLVRSVSCTRTSASCTSTHISSSHYRIMGGSMPGEGFSAILGVNMGMIDDIPNPFVSLGAHRWIIDLPRPGETGSGRLILNPTDAEAADYTPVEIIDSFAAAHSSLHDAIRGCMLNEGSGDKICGAVVLDTGDPGIRIVSASAPRQGWQQGRKLAVFFANAAKQVHIAVRTTISNADQANRLIAEHRPGAPQPFILVGVLPYLAYSVLYDPEHHVLGFKARPVLTGNPLPFRIN